MQNKNVKKLLSTKRFFSRTQKLSSNFGKISKIFATENTILENSEILVAKISRNSGTVAAKIQENFGNYRRRK